jgi:hypothetical protein
MSRKRGRRSPSRRSARFAKKPRPTCTEYGADRCPRCGECVCDRNPETTDGPDRDCPLHGAEATHAENRAP